MSHIDYKHVGSFKLNQLLIAHASVKLQKVGVNSTWHHPLLQLLIRGRAILRLYKRHPNGTPSILLHEASVLLPDPMFQEYLAGQNLSPFQLLTYFTHHHTQSIHCS